MIFAMAVSTIFLVNAFMVLQHPELRATDGETLPNSTGFQADEICSTLDKERIWNEIPKCIPRDTLVSLPPPEDETILEFFPSQVMVPRCSGGCHLSGNHQHKCLPVPKSRYQKPIQVIAKRGSQTFNCSTIELEAHRDCRCGCEIDASNCSADQVFVQTLCQCQCRDFDEQNKCQRTNDKFWDRNSCQCLCLPSVTKECSTGYNFDSIDTCMCVWESPSNQAGFGTCLIMGFFIGFLILVVIVLGFMYRALSKANGELKKPTNLREMEPLEDGSLTSPVAQGCFASIQRQCSSTLRASHGSMQ